MPSHKELITKYQEWGCVLVPLKDGDKKLEEVLQLALKILSEKK